MSCMTFHDSFGALAEVLQPYIWPSRYGMVDPHIGPLDLLFFDVNNFLLGVRPLNRCIETFLRETTKQLQIIKICDLEQLHLCNEK